ncbi:MAG: hypothetical protein KGO05_13140, partial [Chloroflexota bacterium]|nr:hypothetical protein [Chloroflexota bacterium]
MSLGKQAPDANGIAAILDRYRAPIEQGMRAALADAARATTPAATTDALRATLYGQIEYHLGWRDADFTPSEGHRGKLLRPALTLLA